MGGETFAQVIEVVGDGLFRDADQAREFMGRVRLPAQRIGKRLANGSKAGGRWPRLNHDQPAYTPNSSLMARSSTVAETNRLIQAWPFVTAMWEASQPPEALPAASTRPSIQST